mmetsp:Transcript_88079/g.161560  ORF Transcript_88079/g.161560 Transcript_88079/m.161560 type:complete len:209 (-) Transcript_88079:1564-2190(-)
MVLKLLPSQQRQARQAARRFQMRLIPGGFLFCDRWGVGSPRHQAWLAASAPRRQLVSREASAQLQKETNPLLSLPRECPRRRTLDGFLCQVEYQVVLRVRRRPFRKRPRRPWYSSPPPPGTPLRSRQVQLLGQAAHHPPAAGLQPLGGPPLQKMQHSRAHPGTNVHQGRSTPGGSLRKPADPFSGQIPKALVRQHHGRLQHRAQTLPV